MYTCTCTDYLIKSLSCKHIHAVHMARNNVEIKPVVEENDCPDYTHSLEVLKLLVHQEKLQTSSDTERLKELDLQGLNDITDLFTTSNSIDVLRALVDGMQNAYTIACGLQKMDSVQHFEKKSEYPSNKNFEKQHRLVSTKKKETKRSKLRLKKPNSDDKIILVNELSTNTAKVCALCFSASDKMGSSSSEFLKCVSCKMFNPF